MRKLKSEAVNKLTLKKPKPEPVPMEKILAAQGVIPAIETSKRQNGRGAPRDPVVQPINVKMPEIPALKVPADLQLFARALTQEVIKTVYEVCRNHNYRAADRLRASEILLERGWGKAAQELNLGVSEGNQLKIDLARLSKEEFLQMKELTQKSLNLQ